jgi:putative adhesin
MTTVRRQLAFLASCLLALSACDVVEIAAQSERARGTFERTLTVNGPVDLSVRTGSGGIQIRTGSADRVQIVGRVSAGNSRDGLDAAERVRRVEGAPPISQTGNVIRIGDTQDDPVYRNVSISYELVVPANTRINAQTGSGSQSIGSVDGPVRAQTGSGNIRIERTGGSLEAQTGSGDIQADSVGGEVRAQTGSGSVDVRQIVKADVTVQTGSGSVRLSLPADAAYTLDAQTGSGSISTSQPLTVQGRIGRHRVTGTVRGGGQNIRVRTGSGSIDIR